MHTQELDRLGGVIAALLDHRGVGDWETEIESAFDLVDLDSSLKRLLIQIPKKRATIEFHSLISQIALGWIL